MTKGLRFGPILVSEALGLLGLVLLVLAAACCFGCTSANANYLGYAESVVAMQSLDTSAAPPIVFPDNTSAEKPDVFAATGGVRLPGPTPASDFAVSLDKAPYPAPIERIEPLLSKEEIKPDEVAIRPSSCGPAGCSQPSQASYQPVRYVNAATQAPQAQAGPGRRLLWRATHPFGGKGIPLVRRFTRR